MCIFLGELWNLQQDVLPVLIKAYFLGELVSYGIYNDTARHVLPVLINAHSNAYANLYGHGNCILQENNLKLCNV